MVVWLISSTVGGYLNIIFPLLLLQIVKLTCTLDFDLNRIVSASRLDTQPGSENELLSVDQAFFVKVQTCDSSKGNNYVIIRAEAHNHKAN